MRKRSEPICEGTLHLTSDYDSRLAGAKRSPKPYDVIIVLWPDSKSMRKGSGNKGKNTVACCFLYDNPVRRKKKEKARKGAYDIGRAHFVIDNASNSTIVHEVVHLTNHAEYLIGEHDEERSAYRAQRLFEAIHGYVKKERRKWKKRKK